MAITNSTIAQAVNDLVEYWDALNLEYATWLAGSVGGGPGLDGKYALTDYLGNVRMTDCPAQLEDNVNSLVTGAQGYSDAADASATAAAASAAAASTSAGEADSDRIAAQAAQTAAESAQSAAESARTTAIAQASAASASAAAAAADAISTAADAASTAADAIATAADVTYSAEWANKAHGVLVSAAAGGDQVDDYSALHWATEAATFNPALYALVGHVHEGTEIDATGVTDGYVLTADGAGNAAWELGAVPGDFAELGTVTQSDTYLYLNRNTAGGGGPALHIAQIGSGPILQMGKAASLGSTTYDPKITFGDASLPGSMTIESTVGDASIYLKADTSNTVETANPFIRMEQDGNLVWGIFGLTGADNVDPQGTAMTGAGNNSLVIHAPYNASEINLGVDGSVGLTITGTDQILGGSTWGSAGFPTFSSAVDANSGMYVSASDTLGFSTGGIERVKIDVNGLTMVASGADLILGNNSLTADNISSSAGAAPIQIGNGTGTPMVWGQYCALGRTYSAARTGLANNAYVDTDDVVSGQWRHLVTHGSYGHTILEMAAGTFFFYGKSESVTSGNVVSLNQYAQMDPGNGFKITGTGNVNPGTSWSSLSKDMLHIDGKETIDGNDTYLRLNQNYDYSSGVYTPGVFRVDGGLKLNADCTLSRQSSSQCRVTTAYGYCDIGPNNTSYAHFNTDRTKFYFNKEIHINGTSRYYNKGALYYNGSTSYVSGMVTYSTSAATGGTSGDIWYQYT